MQNSGAIQALARNFVHVGGEVIVGNKVGMISLSSGDNFVAQAGVSIHFQHVNAGVWDTGGDQLIQRLVPALASLVRQAGNEIDVDIRNSGGTQLGNIVDHRGTLVQPANRCGFLVGKRLHS